LSVIFVLSAIIIDRHAIMQYITMRKVFVHWSAIMTGAALLLMGFQFFAFAVLDRIILLLKERTQQSDLDQEAKALEKK